MDAARRLRELLARPGPILAPGVYDCISAKVAERAGFPLVAISGAGLTASLLGYPDVGLNTFPEMLNGARNIARSVNIPVIVDADTGYGNALNVMRTTREFEAAGLAGMLIEDQTFPKRCGHLEGKKVIPAEEMVVKIKAACEARRSDDFVIIARTDARATHGLDHALERAGMYCEAGADLIFIDALLSEEELKKAGQTVPKPLMANTVEGGKTPLLHYQELHELGFKIICYASLIERAAVRAGQDILELWRREGSGRSAYPDKIVNLADRNELLGLSEYYELEERLYGPLMETDGSWRKELDEKAAAHKAVERLRI